MIELRRLESGDWEAVHAWARLPEVCRFQAWGPNTAAQSRAFVLAAVDAWDQDPQDRYVYAATSSEGVVGLGEFHVRSRTHGQGEISYTAHPRVWGRGVGTAIGRALVRIGFEELGMHRIYATCDPRNEASAAVLRKLGMTPEGVLRQTMRLRDGWRDSAIYSILADQGETNVSFSAP